MRIAFAGTPEFAAAALSALAEAGHAIVLVLTQPDRPAGRGLRLQASPVKQRALALGAPVAQPRSLRLDGRFPDDAAQARALLEAAQPDVMVVAAYGLILPAWVLTLPPLGCINIHASLLPRWRGAAPIHRAIEAGDRDSGITLMQMDEGLDTGDMLLAQAEPIRADDTTGTLHDRLAALGARLIVQALAAPAALRRVPQPAQGITYAHKIDKAEAAVDWTQPAAVIERRVRAFDPFPGAVATLDGQPLKIWRSEIDSAKAPEDAGQGHIWHVGPDRIHVACGGGSSLCLTEVQRPGGRRQSVTQYLQGHDIKPGMGFGPAGVSA